MEVLAFGVDRETVGRGLAGGFLRSWRGPILRRAPTGKINREAGGVSSGLRSGLSKSGCGGFRPDGIFHRRLVRRVLAGGIYVGRTRIYRTGVGLRSHGLSSCGPAQSGRLVEVRLTGAIASALLRGSRGALGSTGRFHRACCRKVFPRPADVSWRDRRPAACRRVFRVFRSRACLCGALAGLSLFRYRSPRLRNPSHPTRGTRLHAKD